MTIPTRVTPATMEMVRCEIELSAATKLRATCGVGSKRTATNTTTI